MFLEDVFFWSVVGIFTQLFIFSLWGWGFLYSLSKITKYRNMFIGAVGCFGLMALVAVDLFQSLPNNLFQIVDSTEKILKVKSQIANFEIYYGMLGAQLLFQICVVAALAGRFRLKFVEENQKRRKNTGRKRGKGNT